MGVVQVCRLSYETPQESEYTPQMAIYAAFLALITELWFKPFGTTSVDTIFMKLPQ